MIFQLMENAVLFFTRPFVRYSQISYEFSQSEGVSTERSR